jgi:hypothetical protein
VGLHDEVKPAEKKKGLFSFAHSDDKSLAPQTDKKSHGLFTGRKRGQSGAGSELRAMDRPLGQSTIEGRAETAA